MKVWRAAVAGLPGHVKRAVRETPSQFNLEKHQLRRRSLSQVFLPSFSLKIKLLLSKMMTTAAIPRTPLGDVSNKENLVPMKSKNQAPSLPIDTENGFQQVCSVLFSYVMKSQRVHCTCHLTIFLPLADGRRRGGGSHCPRQADGERGATASREPQALCTFPHHPSRHMAVLQESRRWVSDLWW